MNTPTGNGADRAGLAALLARLKGQGVDSPELMEALQQTPRRGFVPSQWQDATWTRGSIPIGCGEMLEGVDLQARVLSALQLEPGHRVLEVGTGSGYTAALLSRLTARVLTVERFRSLADEARKRFAALGITNVTVKHFDASNGSPQESPFDRIVVWAAFESLPRSFADQLATNGVMVAPIGPGDGQQDLAKLTKVGSRFDREDLERVRFQPIAKSIAAAL